MWEARKWVAYSKEYNCQQETTDESSVEINGKKHYNNHY